MVLEPWKKSKYRFKNKKEFDANNKKKAEKEKEKTFSNKSIATITEQSFTVNLLDGTKQ